MSYLRYKNMRKTGQLPAPSKELVIVPKKKAKNADRAYVKRAINKALSPETDTYYSDNQTLTCSTTQQYLDITATLRSSVNISGISLVNKELLMEGYIVPADALNRVRLVIFKWRSDTAVSTPTSDSVLRNDASGAVTFGLPHWEKRKTYKILYNKLFSVQPQAAGAVNDPQLYFKIRLTGKQLGVSQYNQGVTTGTNHIYIMYCSDSAVASHPYIAYNLRMLYQGDD